MPFAAGAGEEAIALGFDDGDGVATDARLPLSGEDDEALAAAVAVAIVVAVGRTGDTDHDVEGLVDRLMLPPGFDGLLEFEFFSSSIQQLIHIQSDRQQPKLRVQLTRSVTSVGSVFYRVTQQRPSTLQQTQEDDRLCGSSGACLQRYPRHMKRAHKIYETKSCVKQWLDLTTPVDRWMHMSSRGRVWKLVTGSELKHDEGHLWTSLEKPVGKARMGRVYDGKKRWNETVLRTNAASASTSASAQRNKKTKRFSGRTMKLSKAMQHVDEETRTVVRNARLDALEADNFGVDAETGDGADDASDDMYVDEDDTNGGGATAAAKDKKARKNRKPALKPKAKKWKVKNLAQLVFEEHGAGDDSNSTGINDTPPTYISVAAGPSTHPPRRFCCVCGFFAVYSCTRCGSRYCRVKCGDHHKESGCLKFGL